MAEQQRPNGNGEVHADYAGEAASAFRDTMHEAEDFVQRQWRENPIGVAAVVAGVGVLLGILLTRRR